MSYSPHHRGHVEERHPVPIHSGDETWAFLVGSHVVIRGILWYNCPCGVFREFATVVRPLHAGGTTDHDLACRTKVQYARSVAPDKAPVLTSL